RRDRRAASGSDRRGEGQRCPLRGRSREAGQRRGAAGRRRHAGRRRGWRSCGRRSRDGLIALFLPNTEGPQQCGPFFLSQLTVAMDQLDYRVMVSGYSSACGSTGAKILKRRVELSTFSKWWTVVAFDSHCPASWPLMRPAAGGRQKNVIEQSRN